MTLLDEPERYRVGRAAYDSQDRGVFEGGRLVSQADTPERAILICEALNSHDRFLRAERRPSAALATMGIRHDPCMSCGEDRTLAAPQRCLQPSGHR